MHGVYKAVSRTLIADGEVEIKKSININNTSKCQQCCNVSPNPSEVLESVHVHFGVLLTRKP